MKVVIKPSTNKEKKYMAIFYDGDKKVKITHFGQNKEQRDRYRTRHKKDLDTGDYKRAGYLSYYILWGDNTSITENINNYKKKFNLT